jgi:hypothetical protein
MNHPTNPTEKGLRCEILTGSGDYSNDGLSSHVQEVTLLDPTLTELTTELRQRRGFAVALHAPTSKAPGVRLTETRPGYLVARPDGDRQPGTVGWMASGAYIVSNDGRFATLTGSPRPIPLHDRTEATEQYSLHSD